MSIIGAIISWFAVRHQESQVKAMKEADAVRNPDDPPWTRRWYADDDMEA